MQEIDDSIDDGLPGVTEDMLVRLTECEQMVYMFVKTITEVMEKLDNWVMETDKRIGRLEDGNES